MASLKKGPKNFIYKKKNKQYISFFLAVVSAVYKINISITD